MYYWSVVQVFSCCLRVWFDWFWLIYSKSVMVKMTVETVEARNVDHASQIHTKEKIHSVPVAVKSMSDQNQYSYILYTVYTPNCYRRFWKSAIKPFLFNIYIHDNKFPNILTNIMIVYLPSQICRLSLLEILDDKTKIFLVSWTLSKGSDKVVFYIWNPCPPIIP